MREWSSLECIVSWPIVRDFIIGLLFGHQYLQPTCLEMLPPAGVYRTAGNAYSGFIQGYYLNIMSRLPHILYEGYLISHLGRHVCVQYNAINLSTHQVFVQTIHILQLFIEYFS